MICGLGFWAAYESGDLELAKLAATFQVSTGWASLLCICNGTVRNACRLGRQTQNSTQLWFCTYNCQSSMNNAAIPDLALASSLLMASNQLRAQFRKCTSIVPKCQHPVRRTAFRISSHLWERLRHLTLTPKQLVPQRKYEFIAAYGIAVLQIYQYTRWQSDENSFRQLAPPCTLRLHNDNRRRVQRASQTQI